MKRVWILLSIVVIVTLVVCARRTSIEVISNPEGADVYLDDTLTEEKTNCVLKDVEPGEHTVAVRLEGYSIWEETFTLEEGETYTVEAIFEEIGSLKWKYRIGDTVSSGLAIGTDGTVYFGSLDGIFYAMNSDGTLKWKYQTGGRIIGFPAIDSDESIYFVSEDGYIYALSQQGTLKWSYNVGSELEYTSPAIGNEGSIYLPCDTGLCAFDNNGNLMWFHRNVIVTPSISNDGTIYCDYSEPDELYSEVLALNHDGSEKWRCSIGENWLWSSPAIGSDGEVYYGALPNEFLIAVNPDGSIDWISDDTLLACAFGSPSIGVDGTLYLNSVQGVCAVTPTGTLKWMNETSEGRIGFSPTLGFDGSIYFLDFDGFLYALKSNGQERWRFQASGGIWHPPAPVIASDGTIYFGSTDGYLYAIYSDSRGLANSPWPKYCHDNQNTGRAGTP